MKDKKRKHHRIRMRAAGEAHCLLLKIPDFCRLRVWNRWGSPAFRQSYVDGQHIGTVDGTAAGLGRERPSGDFAKNFGSV
jgi:hypothetical protein